MAIAIIKILGKPRNFYIFLIGYICLLLLVTGYYLQDIRRGRLQSRLHLNPYNPHLRLISYNPELPTNYTVYSWQPAGYQRAMGKFLLQKFSEKKNGHGFFVEAGAFDGHLFSNTIELEKRYNWSGLLIEGDRDVFARLKARNRRAWIANVCLSPVPYPIKVNMTDLEEPSTMAKVVRPGETVNETQFTRKFEVECFPLAMLLVAIGRNRVDYLSLDVDGLDLDVLKTIPWNQIYIKLVSVERNDKTKGKIRKFMRSVGYKLIKELDVESDFLHDDIFERQETEGAWKLRRNYIVELTDKQSSVTEN